MFKRYLMGFLVVLSMITGGTAPVFASSTSTKVKVTMPPFQVFLNNTKIDNVHSLYPLILYKDITYFPMTWNYTRALGLSTTWDSNTSTLGIEKSQTQEMVKQDLTGQPNSNHVYQATLSNFTLNVNGKTIDNAKEEYPVLLFRDITYFPMTWRFTHDEFQWQSSWDSVAGFQITTNTNPSNHQTSMDNLNLLNGGQVASDGEWIYYNPNNRWYDPNYLYKMKVDGSEKQKLTDDNAISINVSGDWIYYVIHDVKDGNKGIYRIRKDGTQRTKLSDSATQQITIDDNGIYFVDDQLDKSGSNVNYQPVGIKRMNLDGTNETSVYTGSVSQNLHVLKDEIYFSQNNHVYKMQKDGTQVTKISDQSIGNSFMIIDDWIYYSSGKSLYKMSLDGSQIIPFYTSDQDISYPQIYHDGWIYFKQGTFGIMGAATIKKVRIDGTNATTFLDKVRPSAFYFIGSTFYFTNAWEGNAELSQIGADGQIIDLTVQ